MIDQTAFGHEFLWEQFRVIPTIGWQIDPFGHSVIQGSLLSNGIDFDALYMTRIDHQEYDIREKNKNLDFIWRPSPSRGKYSQVFTGVIQKNYLAPEEVHFGKSVHYVDDPKLYWFNMCEQLDLFYKMIKERSNHQKGNHIFLPMGDDFQYKNAHEWYKNMDKLIHYANQDGKVNVFYSTLGLYTKEKNKETNIAWNVKTDDFMPYANNVNGWWSGYFTSRPTVKRFIRLGNSLLQSLRQLETQFVKEKQNSFNRLRAEVSLVQHHDAITGTEKQFVSNDYVLRLSDAVVEAEKNMNQDILAKIFPNISENPFHFCLLSNVSICEVTTTTSSSSSGELLVYNPLPHAQTTTMSVPINSTSGLVTNKKQNNLKISLEYYFESVCFCFSG